MADNEYVSCKCGFGCVKAQLRKTDGKCPRGNCGRLLVPEWKEVI